MRCAAGLQPDPLKRQAATAPIMAGGYIAAGLMAALPAGSVILCNNYLQRHGYISLLYARVLFNLLPGISFFNGAVYLLFKS